MNVAIRAKTKVERKLPPSGQQKEPIVMVGGTQNL
jgi:hypothetical protein